MSEIGFRNGRITEQTIDNGDDTGTRTTYTGD